MQPFSFLQTVGLLFLSMTLIVSGDTAGKALTAHGFGPFFIAWSRFALGFVMVLPFSGLARSELRVLLDWRLLLRAVLIAATICSILTGLRTEPIANVYGGFFIGPIVSYFLSALLLGERITRTRTVLLLVSFVGVLMVVKPVGGISPGMGFAVLAGCFYGAFLVATRWLGGDFRPRLLLISQLAIGSVLLLPVAAAPFPDFSPGIFALVLASAAASAGGNFLLVIVSRVTPASLVAPLVYSQLIAATLLGLIVFGDFPDAIALAGLTIILVTGLSSLWLADRGR
jgi:drug/metabolite transporter (DMT)-like permease